MKRISQETFVNGKWEENVTGLQIENGEFYWICDIEEWPDYPEFNKDGLRIFAPYNGSVILDRALVFEGSLNICEASNYENTPMTYYYETEEECKKFKNVYECMLEYIQPYRRNKNSDPDDYDIFIMNKQELIDFCDALKDGDYIIILNN